MSSFFKRPSWATKNAEEAGTEFYRRSGQTYSDIVAATREAHQKPKASTTPKSPEDPEDAKRKKRPRLSDETKKEHEDSGQTQDTAHEADSEKSVPATPQEARSSSRNSSLAPVNQYQAGQQHGPENQPYASPPKPKSPGKQRPLPAQLPIVLVDKPETGIPQSLQPPTVQADKPVARSPQAVKPAPSPVNDPVVQIIISSEIPNTKPLLVHRKMSQSLRDVRIAWCNRQNFEPELQSSVYLTWKGRRLFDVTTCRSLGAQAIKRSSSILDTEDDSQNELRIHIEAVTDAPLPPNRQTTSPDNNKYPAVSQILEDDQGEPMKLVLRSPGLNDFKIKARPTTLVSRLISAFRDKQKISADRDISLEFDGDKLEPDACLGDYDIDNLDLVDVLIR
jgi:hypothetical protein